MLSHHNQKHNFDLHRTKLCHACTEPFKPNNHKINKYCPTCWDKFGDEILLRGLNSGKWGHGTTPNVRYEHCDDIRSGERIMIHRLAAIAGGADPHKVFSGDYHVHHKDGNPWINNPDNLELLTASEHISQHIEERTTT